MKLALINLLFPITLFLFSCSENNTLKYGDNKSVINSNWKGRYFGYEMMCWEIDSSGKRECFRDGLDSAEWKGRKDSTNYFYIKKLLVKKDSVYMDVFVRKIVGRDTLSSEGSGGNYYRGKLIDNGIFKEAKMLNVGCGLCGVPFEFNPKTKLYDQKIITQNIKLEKLENGLIVNGIHFKPEQKDNFKLLSESVKYERIIGKRMK